MTPPLVLTRRETADLLNTSPSTVSRMVADGRLPSIDLGSSLRIPRAAVEQLVAEKVAEWQAARERVAS